MIVEPYRRNPKPPVVALLLPSGEVVNEHGEDVDLDDWPPDHRLWCSYETAYTLVREGKGEALCWNGEEIRWRHDRHETEWVRRSSDANVIKLPFSHLPVETQLRGFCLWRDWLAAYGASPAGTSGSAAWSLLRARLERRLVTSSGERPPLRQTVGGRQELGPGGPGEYRGRLLHLDLPAAYASTLAGLRYGGVWLDTRDEPGRRLTDYAGADTPVFVRARVRIPATESGGSGPLIQRPRRITRSYLESMLVGSLYPAGTRLQGFWTWEELQAAEASGARIERVLGGWVHRSGWHPFVPWWDAIVEGRALGGLAGQLAKMTGNALWGRFCMDPRVSGRRTIRRRVKTGTRTELISRMLPERPAPWPAHDLAETVSGRVRARLFLGMLAAGDGLVSAHTDGLWIRGVVDVGEDWRMKDRAAELDLLGPQKLRYRPKGGDEWWYCVSGVPAERAPELFQHDWEEAGFAAA